jgi:hypothetical protein
VDNIATFALAGRSCALGPLPKAATAPAGSWGLEDTGTFACRRYGPRTSADLKLAARFSFGFFNFQSRTLSSIAAINSHDHQTEMTANPTTHMLRATVKKTIRNAILKI